MDTEYKAIRKIEYSKDVWARGWNVKFKKIDYNWGELNIYADTRYDMAEDCLMEAAPMMPRAIDIEPDDIDVRDTATFVWEIE